MPAFLYRTEGYDGDPAALAEDLRLVGITVRESEDNPCTEWRDDDGHRWREVGDVCVYAGERIVVWPCTDASPADRVVLLRSAERVVRGYDGAAAPEWEHRVTTSGQRYRVCSVSVPVDDQHGREAVSMSQQDVDAQFLALTAGVLAEVG